MKNGRLILWTAVAICEVSKTSWQKGKLSMKDDLENHSKGPIIPFGAMVEYHPISTPDSHQIGKNVLPELFLGCALIAGNFGKEIFLVADIEELEKIDASEIYPRRINAKDVRTPKKERTFHIPSCRGHSKNVRTRPRIPRTHS